MSKKEEYSEQLGNFLREAEEKHKEKDWFKQLSLNKLGKGRRKRQKNDKRKKDKNGTEDWVQFQSLKLSSSVKGEAEIMFEAIAKINERLEELNDAQDSVKELRKIGFGNDVNYICYLENGVVRKVVVKPIDENVAKKFTFMRGFTTIQPIQPL
jgi:hypothetical protein